MYNKNIQVGRLVSISLHCYDMIRSIEREKKFMIISLNIIISFFLSFNTHYYNRILSAVPFGEIVYFSFCITHKTFNVLQNSSVSILHWHFISKIRNGFVTTKKRKRFSIAVCQTDLFNRVVTIQCVGNSKFLFCI